MFMCRSWSALFIWFFFFASYKYTTKEGQITSFAVLLCLHSPPPSWTINVRLVRLLQLSKLGLQVADENSDLELCWKILFFGPNFEGIVKFCMPSINRPTLLNNKNQLNPRWGGNIFQIWWCKLFFFKNVLWLRCLPNLNKVVRYLKLAKA